jgi:hypothetical protein
MFPNVLTSLAATTWVFTLLVSTVSGGPTSAFDIFSRTPAEGINVKTLAPYLSAKAKIYLPGTKEFATYTTRWSNLEAPTPNVVIAPGTEKDVQKIVSPSIGGRLFYVSTVQIKSSANDSYDRSNLRTIITFPFSRTTAIMARLRPWARWTTALRSICPS